MLNGRLDWGWLYAWGLLLLTMLPLRIFSSWLQEQLVIGSGVLLKRRLLAGALNMDPDDLRHQGVGQLLGCVIESDAIEFLALSGGFPALKALIELALAALILATGAAGWLHTLLLIAWTGLLLVLIRRFGYERARWTDARLHMTHDLIEQMVGHRTLLAQQPRAQWHTGDDQRLEQYVGLSWAMDRTTAWLIALVPRGWLLASLVLLLPAVVARSTLAGLAISVGATLLAFQAFGRLSIGSAYLAGALIAWQQVAPLFRAAARSAPSGGPLVLQPAAAAMPAQRAAVAANAPQPLLSTHNISYRYRADGPAVLSGCTMQICAGDRMLLEGPSGSGKSTLAALITGLRQPGAGLLLLRGLDRQTIGADEWRRQVAAAPQFHENHVLSETFAFNLLLGRRWPPRPQDMAEAEAICYDLGLGDLLERMPAGLLQIVGETGWQLSHGEKSRLYLAQALLQDAALVVLDESFAALDPETLKLALNCALQRAPTLLVIAHP